MTVEGSTVVVVGAGYLGKRRLYERIAELGARITVVDETGHWSQRLVADGLAAHWVAAPIAGDADADAAAVVDALAAEGIRPDAVLTFWETSVPVAARAAAALGLPGNPVAAVDAARSKLRTREESARAGLPTPRSQRVRSLDELFAAAEAIGFPSVVKPEFGASAVGCVRIDSFESLPGVYKIVRSELATTDVVDLRAGNDLLLEEYLDGVEFDVDLVLHDGECVFSSVSQNWPTAEPSFQETGLHCPPDHGAKPVRRLVQLCVETVQAFGFRYGVLHVEGKCTSRGPASSRSTPAWAVGGSITSWRRCGDGPDRGPSPRRPRPAPAACAEPEAALRRRQRAPLCPRDGPAGSPCISPRPPRPTWDRWSTWRLMWDKRSTDRTGSSRRRSPR